LVNAEVVEVQAIAQREFLDVVLHEHGHTVHKVFGLALPIDKSSNSYLRCCIFTPCEVKLYKHLSLIFEIFLLLLTVNQFLQMLMLLRDVSEKKNEGNSI
jgi:hypothetical protein